MKRENDPSPNSRRDTSLAPLALPNEKMEALARLAGGMAHDFNNLLTIISGYGALLQASLKGNRESEQMVNEVMDAAAKAAELTRQLLVFSGRQPTQLQPVDLNERLSGLLESLRNLAGANISIELQLAPRLENVSADPRQLEIILGILVENAKDAMPQGGRITIRTEQRSLPDGQSHGETGSATSSYVQLSLSDTGEGMDVSTKARIFEPFFTTKGAGKRTALGLATVYGIVQRSGGEIFVHSEPGRGATFVLRLPPAGHDEPKVEQRSDPSSTQGNGTVLLVEDEPSVRKLAHSILQANGYDVLIAGSPQEALSRANNFPGSIRLLVTDIVMPGSNGHELALQLLKQRPQVKVVFMSGYSEHAILERILAEPGAIFLQKPFTPAQLLRAIREVLN